MSRSRTVNDSSPSFGAICLHNKIVVGSVSLHSEWAGYGCIDRCWCLRSIRNGGLQDPL
jgi:hypothetical protein